MNDLYISGINWESTVDGSGVRVTLYISGCIHNCKGCHNPETHRFDNGEHFSEDTKMLIFKYFRDKRKFITGLTLSGGDPMCSADKLLPFVKEFKERFPDKDIWIYSGYRYDEIRKDKSMNDLLSECVVLVDGKFEIDKVTNGELLYRGSSNQRIIQVGRNASDELACDEFYKFPGEGEHTKNMTLEEATCKFREFEMSILNMDIDDAIDSSGITFGEWVKSNDINILYTKRKEE